jgi:hypothetical protein
MRGSGVNHIVHTTVRKTNPDWLKWLMLQQGINFFRSHFTAP